ncbi:MAG: 30S ribosomal protein S5 [Patescibacteria group bacterium]
MKPTKQNRKKEPSDIDHRLIDLRRVARVVAGGRRFSFRAAVVAGDHKGKVGIGVAKGTDTASAIGKALSQAKKHMIQVPLTEQGGIARPVEEKLGPSRVRIKPVRLGKGLLAGGPARTVFLLAGITGASAKILSRSTNKINNASAVIAALKKLKK